jgi:hypothetical protein
MTMILAAALHSHDPAAANYLQVSAGPALAVRCWSAGMYSWHPLDHATCVAMPAGLPALRARRCCATSGGRIVLRFASADGAQTGEGIRVDRVRVRRSDGAFGWSTPNLTTLGARAR